MAELPDDLWFTTYGTQQEALDAAFVHALPSQTLASPVCFPPVSMTPCSRLYTILALYVQPNLNDLPQVFFSGHTGSWTSPPPVTPVHFCARHLLLNMRALALGGAVDGGRDGYGLPGELQAPESANNLTESANSQTEESRRAHALQVGLERFLCHPVPLASHFFGSFATNLSATLFLADHEYGGMPVMDWDTPPPSLISAASSSSGDEYELDWDHPRLPANLMGG